MGRHAAAPVPDEPARSDPEVATAPSAAQAPAAGRAPAADQVPAAPETASAPQTPEAAGPAEALAAAPTVETAGPRSARPWVREAVVLGGVGAIAAAASLAWAVGTWWIAVLGALGAAVVISGATWVAHSVPGPDPRPDGPPKVER